MSNSSSSSASFSPIASTDPNTAATGATTTNSSSSNNNNNSSSSSSSNNDDFGGSTTAPNFEASSQFSPSMAIILVVLLSAFFFMGFFSIYVKRCTGDEDTYNPSRGGRGGGGAGRESGIGGGRAAAAQAGLDPALLQRLPLVSYSSSSKRKSAHTNLECVVCLTDFEEGEPLRQLPKCKHVFHPDCIDMWLYSHTTCPLCRRGVAAADPSFRWGGSYNGAASSLHFFGSRRSAGGDTPDQSGGRNGGGGVAIDVPEGARRGSAGGSSMPLPRSHSTGHSLLMRALSHTRLRGTPPLAMFVDAGEEAEVDLQRSRSEAEGRRGGRCGEERLRASSSPASTATTRAAGEVVGHGGGGGGVLL